MYRAGLLSKVAGRFCTVGRRCRERDAVIFCFIHAPSEDDGGRNKCLNARLYFTTDSSRILFEQALKSLVSKTTCVGGLKKKGENELFPSGASTSLRRTETGKCFVRAFVPTKYPRTTMFIQYVASTVATR